MTLDEATSIIEDLNDQAHDDCWDDWEFAGDDEELREEASMRQQMRFEELFDELLPYTQVKILKLCISYKDLGEQFETYCGSSI